MTTLRILPVLLFASLFFACTKNAGEQPSDPVLPGAVEKTAEMNQTLGWKLFAQEQINKPGENILISPFSIQTALYMAANGARGNTLDEILALMAGQNCTVADLNSLQQDLTALLTEQSGHPSVTVANSYFYDKNRITVKTPFLNALSGHYACSAQHQDFDAEQTALDAINGWVKAKTNGKIDKILDEITAYDVAFLINALHFKADWATGFAPNLTTTQLFTKADGTTIPVEFVNADRNYTFAQTAALDLVDIPFRDSTFSLSFIKPTAGNTDPDWSLNINPETWNALYDQVQNQRAIVHFPKLKLEYDNDLIKSLRELGVHDAFSDSAADFTDMGSSTAGNIFIKQIKHKAVLEVDERGAEGAAVTSIGFGFNSLPPVFLFNSPFVLVLRHIPTNTMLFTGLVTDPSF